MGWSVRVGWSEGRVGVRVGWSVRGGGLSEGGLQHAVKHL